ncbi:hypothetical protein [Amycolatopsis sp. NPDC059021]|uniref:hypothetical protein n=1 Tax=Amycolatopsis sp. NPDC059021 TaxID=3346704 RepID=UPI00366F9F8C
MAVLAGSAAVLAMTLTPAASPAPAAQHCVYSAGSKNLSCYRSVSEATVHGRQLASVSGDVIGATVFDQPSYGGASLTITVPKPCVKDDKVDWWLDLQGFWRKRISSVQSWANCWVWLYREDNSREGPYTGNVPDVGSQIDNQAVTVGLS